MPWNRDPVASMAASEDTLSGASCARHRKDEDHALDS